MADAVHVAADTEQGMTNGDARRVSVETMHIDDASFGECRKPAFADALGVQLVRRRSVARLVRADGAGAVWD